MSAVFDETQSSSESAEITDNKMNVERVDALSVEQVEAQEEIMIGAEDGKPPTKSSSLSNFCGGNSFIGKFEIRKISFSSGFSSGRIL